jgi:hypothetical protein
MICILCSEQKCNSSKKFAAEAGLPVLTNVLLPKTKGFHTCLETLRDSLDAGLFYNSYSFYFLQHSVNS